MKEAYAEWVEMQKVKRAIFSEKLKSMQDVLAKKREELEAKRQAMRKQTRQAAKQMMQKLRGFRGLRADIVDGYGYGGSLEELLANLTALLGPNATVRTPQQPRIMIPLGF